jgi:dihydrofolate reductase
MMKVSAIVAVAKNGVIGFQNQIPWHLPADLAYFKRTTTGHSIIMGRKCYESIGKPLPNRTNIVITRDLSYTAQGCIVLHSIEAALQYALDQGESEAFVIGGGEIYTQSQDYWDTLHLTEVDIEPEGDIYFTKPDLTKWRLTQTIDCLPDEKNKFGYSFLTYHCK